MQLNWIDNASQGRTIELECLYVARICIEWLSLSIVDIIYWEMKDLTARFYVMDTNYKANDTGPHCYSSQT